jgi:hypothetical protein
MILEEQSMQLPLNPENLIFWGELQLLNALQQKRLKSFSQSTAKEADGTSRPSQIYFNARRSHQDIAISGDSKVVSHRNSKLWASISGVKGFFPGTGVHEWALRIDKSDRGHVFVGVVTADASMESYIGSDRFGWGVIGTKALWHGRAKTSSDFGVGFGNQSIVKLRLDTDMGTLCISSGDSRWVLAFENLPGVELFSAVSLYHRDDRISLVPSEATPSVQVPLTSAPGYIPGLTEMKVAKDSEAVTSFVRYAQILCSHVNVLLTIAEDMENLSEKAGVLSHPFVGMLLPSVSAAAIAYQVQIS